MLLGVNYKAAEANWAADAAYFRTIGVNAIRPHLAAIGSPWSAGTDSAGSHAFFRRCAKYFADQGFTVMWGIAGYNGFNGAGQMTATRWGEYRDIVLGEAAYLQSRGMTNIIFEIGNEMEATADGTTLTVSQLVTNIGTLATDVKAVFRGKVAYSPWDFNNTTYNTWITNGKGGLDYINVHPYCNSTSSNRGIVYGGYAVIAKMIKKFGPESCWVTEFGMEAGAAAVAALPTYIKRAGIREMWKFMENLGFQQGFVYSYVGMLNGDNDFAMKNMDNSFNPQWISYVSDGVRRKTNINA